MGGAGPPVYGQLPSRGFTRERTNGAPPMRTVRNFAVRVARIWFFPRASPTYCWRVSAFRNRRMFAACVDRTLSALSEISYYLDMGYAMGLISKEDHQEIESLGGRALFYSMKLVMSLAGGSPDETA